MCVGIVSVYIGACGVCFLLVYCFFCLCVVCSVCLLCYLSVFVFYQVIVYCHIACIVCLHVFGLFRILSRLPIVVSSALCFCACSAVDGVWSFYF